MGFKMVYSSLQRAELFLSQGNLFIVELPFYNPNNREIPFSLCFHMNTIPGERAERLTYAKVGDRLFTDSSRKLIMEYIFGMKNNSQVVYLQDFNCVFNKVAESQYSGLVVHVLEYIPMEGTHVLDLGCAEGVLSLTSKKLGAKTITAIDISQDRLNLLRRNIDINDLQESDFHLHCQDLTKEGLEALIPTEEIDIVCANLGMNQYKDHPDKAAIQLLDKLPNVKYFVGGGYAKNERHSPDATIKLLAQKGYTSIRWLVQKLSEEIKELKVAFIAQRE